MLKTVDKIGEFGLIDGLEAFQNLLPCVIKGIGDDAAVLKLDARRYQLLTTDMLVEGVHFKRGTRARLVGHKALACNISDIAAMGGRPTIAVVSIGIPSDMTVKYVKDIYAGMYLLARRLKVSIVGGDTVKSDKLVINVALLGEVEKAKLTRRSGARPGDVIGVTGPLGNTLKSGKHLSFIPRVNEARVLVEKFKPTAMMDISDGLAGDLGHILKASRVGAVLDEKRIPLNPGASVKSALYGGEDFELLVTVASGKVGAITAYAQKHRDFKFIPIGIVTKLNGRLQLRNCHGELNDVSAKGYAHF